MIGQGNRYVDEQAPWGLKKTDPERMGTVLYTLADVIRRIAILVQPVVPESAGKLLDQMDVPEDKRSFGDLETALTPGQAVPKPTGVFPRFVDETTDGA